MSVWVTPSLLCGPEDCPTGIPTVRCTTAQEAIVAIEELSAARPVKGAAWVDREDWDHIAFEVITHFGGSPAWARRQIHYARTGVLLDEQDFVEA